jgi:hypothetical protein
MPTKENRVSRFHSLCESNKTSPYCQIVILPEPHEQNSTWFFHHSKKPMFNKSPYKECFTIFDVRIPSERQAAYAMIKELR